MRTIAENLLILRNKAGISQEELAKLVQCSKVDIDNWERGLTVIPVEMLIPIAKALHCSFEELLYQKVEMSLTQRESSINEIIKTFPIYSFRQLRKVIEDVNRQYPDDDQFKVAIATSMFFSLYDKNKDSADDVIDYCLSLLNLVVTNGDYETQKAAAFTKATILLMIDEPTESKLVLDEQQWVVSDPSDLYVQIYKKQGKKEEVRMLVQKMLHENLSRISVLLLSLSDCLNDGNERIELLKKLELLEDEFDVIDKVATMRLIHEFIELEDIEEAKNCLNNYINKKLTNTLTLVLRNKERGRYNLLDESIEELIQLKQIETIKEILDIKLLNDTINQLENLKINVSHLN